jgi:hypothetical protein
MMEYEMVRRRQDEIRRSAEIARLVMDARRGTGPRRTLRLAMGAGLARLALRLAGQKALRAALGEAG